MKRAITVSLLSLLSLAAHAANPNVYTVKDMLENYQNGAQFVNGYVAGIAEVDEKVCTGKVHFGTMSAQVMTTIQAAIEDKPEKAAEIRATSAAVAVDATLENLYPCK